MRSPSSVGLRELRQNLSRYLRRVAAGETLEVTERGRPVAVLAPLPGRARIIDRLVSDGHARRATRPLATLTPPVPARCAVSMTLSEALALLRSDER